MTLWTPATVLRWPNGMHPSHLHLVPVVTSYYTVQVKTSTCHTHTRLNLHRTNSSVVRAWSLVMPRSWVQSPVGPTIFIPKDQVTFNMVAANLLGLICLGSEYAWSFWQPNQVILKVITCRGVLWYYHSIQVKPSTCSTTYLVAYPSDQ